MSIRSLPLTTSSLFATSIWPLTPTEKAIHTYSSSKHCTLSKLLRSSCHLIHWAPQLPCYMSCWDCMFQCCPCSRLQVSCSPEQCWTKTFSTSVPRVLSTVEKVTGRVRAWFTKIMWFNPVRNILSSWIDFQLVTPSSKYFKVALLFPIDFGLSQLHMQTYSFTPSILR